jgi:hypothetical protein
MIIQQGDQHSSLTYSYLALRKAVGWIGILLPFVLMLGGYLIFKEDFTLKNISVYYYTGMRNILVGSLCAISLFLFFYKGYDKWDNMTGNLRPGYSFFPYSKRGAL